MVMLLMKSRRKTGVKVTAVAAVAFIGSVIAFSELYDQEAVAEGFLNSADRTLARDAGFPDADEWAKNRDGVVQARRTAELAEQRLAAANAEREAAEATRRAEAARRQAIAEKAAEETASTETAPRQNASTNEDASREGRMRDKVVSMSNQIILRVRSHYGVEPESLFNNGTFCREDNYCAFILEPFGVTIYGAGLAKVEPSNRVSHAEYLELCGVVFAALTNSDTAYAREVAGSAFSAAAQNGSFKQDLLGLQVNIRPTLSGVLGCRFFSYGEI